jgi:hypothetical protein
VKIVENRASTGNQNNGHAEEATNILEKEVNSVCMLRKINIDEAETFAKIPNIKKYCTNPFYLAFNGYYEKLNEEILLCERDELYRNEFPYINFPTRKENAVRAIATYCTEDDVNQLQKWNIPIKMKKEHGLEYYYKTEDFARLTNASFRKQVARFSNHYNFKILHDYPKTKIISFIRKWAESQKTKNEFFNLGTEYAIFCARKKEKIKGKWLFVEINNELAGYNLSYPFNDQYWVGIHQKVDYEYKGLSRFLLHQRANLFPNIPFFTLGTEAHDEGVKNYKEELHPYRREKRYFIMTE